ncbi:MAG: hypothetical protein GEU78_16265 [Actinobacteria bacterium]|nr:hypothetical protein [Actinomycetota bacterium]
MSAPEEVTVAVETTKPLLKTTARVHVTALGCARDAILAGQVVTIWLVYDNRLGPTWYVTTRLSDEESAVWPAPVFEYEPDARVKRALRDRAHALVWLVEP